MKKSITFLLFQFLFHCSVFSQDITYARNVIDTLTSSFFNGRGVVNEGEKKAANYLANEYQKLGLKQFDATYFQTFTYPINTFLGELSVSFEETKLIAGKDYLVDAKSGSLAGTFKLVWYNKDNVPSKKELKKLAHINFFSNKFIVIDDEGVEKGNELFELLKINVFGAAGIIKLENKKLTQGLSSTYHDFAILRIKRESIHRDYLSITVEINQKLESKYQSQNVIGYVEGTEFSDSFIVVSAHYDHLGAMGNDVFFPGANDNASGVAMLLNLAYHYTHKDPPKKTVVFIAFGAEEAGILGSKFFVEHPTFSLTKINFVMNLDLLGTGDDGVMIVNGAILPQQFEMLEKINAENNYVTAIKKRGKAANSDHYWFTEKGVPAFFMYTMGGITAYHDVDDVAKTLPLTKFEDCFRLIRDFLDEL
ncbi:MAG: aminopeptidase [Flavobacteriales bacterium CG_4_10_14_0_2_um_filter_32_8]|nr:MAG: aminopeptidase [Flavobacteriales bacterium CG_4_10_14_0_2_um_filter_32_8]PJB14023.1 MAG: aminopeptidase [Flavobacteriales bacterium CG_4_9_14_3_um_filter_32_8]